MLGLLRWWYAAGGCKFKPRIEVKCQGGGKGVGVGNKENSSCRSGCLAQEGCAEKERKWLGKLF